MIHRLLRLFVTLMALAPGFAAATEALDGGHYGEVRLTEPSAPMRGFVVLFSDLSGWSDADSRAADLLGRQGLLVVGVDTARYAAKLATTRGTCQYLVGDAETISHQLQRARHAERYYTPILAGIGAGGTLAERVLAGAAANTIAGAVSIDPGTELDPRFHPCPPDPTILHDPGLPGFWGIGETAEPPTAIADLIAAMKLVDQNIDMERFAQSTEPGAMLLALIQTHLRPQAPDEQDMSALPLVELPAQSGSRMLAIVVSGDGGWRDLDQTIAHELQDRGVSVIGVDSLRYFWSRKSPEQTAHDLARVIETYSRRWHATSVALIGYSFGADVLPFAYNRFPPETRAKVAMLSLLGFASAADFEIRVLGWLGMPPSSAALPARPEIAKMPHELVQCFYGEDETDTLCPELATEGFAAIRMPGSHHFGRDYQHLAHIILGGWRRRMTKG